MLRQCRAHTDSLGETEVSSVGCARKKTSPGNRMAYCGSGQDALLLGEKQKPLTLAGLDKKKSGGSLSKAEEVTDWQEISESALQHNLRDSSFSTSAGLQDGSQGGTEAHEGKRA